MINELITYSLEFFLASTVLYLGYRLTRETSNPTFNRFCLLGCMLLSSLFPVLNIEFSTSVISSLQLPKPVQEIYTATDIPSVNVKLNDEELVIDHNEDPKQAKTWRINWTTVTVCIYGVVSLFFIIRMLSGVVTIFKMRRAAEIGLYQGNKIYFVDNPSFSGASFFDLIFIGKHYKESPELLKICAHELEHKNRYHSIDLLLGDFFRVIFWFNPITWLIRKNIRLNAEFEVDHLMTRQFEKKDYANLLVNLSISSGMTRSMIAFSAVSVKKRLHRMHNAKPDRWVVNSLVISFLTLFSFYLVSCSDNVTNEQVLTLKSSFADVRSITTRFTSHQSDTREKSDRIVAAAYFLPDRTLDRFEQHMTYPYNMEAPKKIGFWAEPEAARVPLIMDGLDLSDAENNFLYGNDWPVKFARVAETQHPSFVKDEYSISETTVKYGSTGYPSEILTNQKYEYTFMRSPLWVEHFTYDDGKVSEYNSFYESTTMRGVVKSQKARKVYYEYDGDLLTSISKGRVTIKFEYEDEALVRSEFYIVGKMYNYRRYFYDDRGLKVRTEIVNVNGDPEYTIHYDYEFYENSTNNN